MALGLLVDGGKERGWRLWGGWELGESQESIIKGKDKKKTSFLGRHSVDGPNYLLLHKVNIQF